MLDVHDCEERYATRSGKRLSTGELGGRPRPRSCSCFYLAAMANSLKRAAGRLAAGKQGANRSSASGDSTSVTRLKGKATARKAKRKVRSLG